MGLIGEVAASGGACDLHSSTTARPPERSTTPQLAPLSSQRRSFSTWSIPDSRMHAPAWGPAPRG